MDEQGRIVVGVDGTESGRRALAWALHEARVRRAECLLVHAWSYGVAAAAPYAGDALPQIAQDAQWLLNEELDRARASGVPANGQLVEGSPAKALVEAAYVADLLVVGRGRGSLASAVMGSVSSACVHRAPCPVVVVPPLEAGGP